MITIGILFGLVVLGVIVKALRDIGAYQNEARLIRLKRIADAKKYKINL